MEYVNKDLLREKKSHVDWLKWKSKIQIIKEADIILILIKIL